MPASLTRPAALDIVTQAATLLFENGQTTEETVVAADKLGRALGVPVTLLPYWGELAIRVDGTPLADTVPATPLGIDTVKRLFPRDASYTAVFGLLGILPDLESLHRQRPVQL